MTVGGSLLLVAIGAILRYAVADTWEAVDLTTVGLILMIVGGVGFLIGLFQTAIWSRSVEEREREREIAARDPARYR